MPLDTAVSGAGVSAGSQRNGARARSRFFHPDGRLRTVFCRDKYLAACSVIAKTTDAVDDARIKHRFVAKMLSKRCGLPRRRLNQSFAPESGLAERLFNEQFGFESKLCGILQAPQRTAAADGLAVKLTQHAGSGKDPRRAKERFLAIPRRGPNGRRVWAGSEKIASSTGKCAGHEISGHPCCWSCRSNARCRLLKRGCR